MSVEDRFHRLERSVRVWQCASLGVLFLLIGTGLAPDLFKNRLSGNSLVLQDPKSDAKVSIVFDEVGEGRSAVLRMTDSSGELDSGFSLYVSDGSVFIDMPGSMIVSGEDSFLANFGSIGIQNEYIVANNASGDPSVVLGVNKSNNAGFFQINNDFGEKVVLATSAPSAGDQDGPNRVGAVFAIDPSDRQAMGILMPSE